MNAAVILMLMNSIRRRPSGSCSGVPFKKPTKAQVKEAVSVIIGTSCFAGFIIYLFSTAVI